MGYNKDASNNPIQASPLWTLGRDSFKRTDNGSEQMNIDGLPGGSPVTVWNGTGGGDSGGDWSVSGTGSESSAAAKSGTNGWDTGVMSLDDTTIWNNGSEIDVDGTYSELNLQIRPQAFPTGSRPRLTWLDSTNTKIGDALRIDDYTPNMDLDVWKKIAIPIADFNLTDDVQKLRLAARNTAGQDYHIDDIQLVAASGAGPYRFQFAAPDANTIYHVSMLVLQVTGPASGWNSDAFGSLAGGLTNGLIARQRRISTSDVLWKFVTRNNDELFGFYHPQDDVSFADSVKQVGFMVKPGKASIKVTNDDVCEFVVRDDLSSGITSLRGFAHYGVESI